MPWGWAEEWWCQVMHWGRERSFLPQFFVEHWSDSAAATDWINRGNFWNTWQRCKDKIIRDIQLRLSSSSHLAWPVALCLTTLVTACLGSLMGRGQDAPVYGKQSAHRVWPHDGATEQPWTWVVVGAATILIACRVKAPSGTEELALWTGSEHLRAETQDLST